MSDVTDAIILTLHDRDPLTLLNVFAGIATNDLEKTGVLLVDDRMTDATREAVQEASRYLEDRCPLVIHPLGNIPGVEHGGGYMNLSYANNRGADAALEAWPMLDRIYWMCSDTLIPPHTLWTARHHLDRALWTPRVIDTWTGAEYCGPSRMFPMVWFLGCKLTDHYAIGGFDENFMRGVWYEDNDYVGKLFEHKEKCIIDLSVTAFHQGHDRSYAETPESKEKKKVNHDYIRREWGGKLPFAAGPDAAIAATATELGRHILMKFKSSTHRSAVSPFKPQAEEVAS